MNPTERLRRVGNYRGAEIYYTNNFGDLPASTRKRFEPQLIRAATAAFQRRQITPEFSLDVANHLRGGDLFIVVQNRVAQGFALLQHFPQEAAVYIAGITRTPIAPSGVVESIVGQYVEQEGANKVVVRTQNDRVVEIVTRLTSRVVALDVMAGEPERQLLDRMGLLPTTDFDQERLIIRGYYGGPMIESGERRRVSNPRITSLTDQINYQAGDALLLIGYRK